MPWALGPQGPGRSDLLSLTLSHPRSVPSREPSHRQRGAPERGNCPCLCTSVSLWFPTYSYFCLAPSPWLSLLFMTLLPEAGLVSQAWVSFLPEARGSPHLYLCPDPSDCLPGGCLSLEEPWLCLSAWPLQQRCSETWLWNLGSTGVGWWEVWILTCSL